MKNIRFYLEYPNVAEKHKATVREPGNHSGNVVAAFLRDDGRFDYHISCGDAVVRALSSVFFYPNGDVIYTEVGIRYLGEKCKRIPERLAREIHPKLFEVLDQEDSL